MNLIKILFSGFNLRNLKLAAYGWLFNIFFSILVYLGFYSVFSISAGSSKIAENIELYGLFTMLLDIFNNFPGSFLLVTSISSFLLLGYIAASIFVSGGIFSVLIEEEKATFFTLFSASIENFVKFFKIFLVNIINFVLAIVPVVMLSFFLWETLKSATNETLFRIFLILLILLSIILFIFSVAIYDYSRIIRLKEGRNFLFSFRSGVKFVFSNKRQITGIFLFYIFSSILIHLMLRLLMSSVGGIFNFYIIFIIFQIFMWIRYLLKVIVIHGELGIIQAPFKEEKQEDLV